MFCIWPTLWWESGQIQHARTRHLHVYLWANGQSYGIDKAHSQSCSNTLQYCMDYPSNDTWIIIHSGYNVTVSSFTCLPFFPTTSLSIAHKNSDYVIPLCTEICCLHTGNTKWWIDNYSCIPHLFEQDTNHLSLTVCTIAYHERNTCLLDNCKCIKFSKST